MPCVQFNHKYWQATFPYKNGPLNLSQPFKVLVTDSVWRLLTKPKPCMPICRLDWCLSLLCEMWVVAMLPQMCLFYQVSVSDLTAWHNSIAARIIYFDNEMYYFNCILNLYFIYMEALFMEIINNYFSK